jgi:hypothetical protein
MRRVLVVGLALAGMMGLSGCLAVSTPALGVLYAEVWHGGDAEGGIGAKEGKSCAQSILGLVATGDASVKAAAAAGGIKNVTRVDHYSKNILGILGEYCTIVGGS